jgi:hypothetical protein
MYRSLLETEETAQLHWFFNSLLGLASVNKITFNLKVSILGFGLKGAGMTPRLIRLQREYEFLITCRKSNLLFLMKKYQM